MPEQKSNRIRGSPKKGRPRKQKQNSGSPTHPVESPLSIQTRRFPVFSPQHFQKGMLYYDNQLSLTPLIGGSAVGFVFSANGMFDPNITGTGHQPMGFDQLMAFYEQYHVTNCVMTVRVNAYATTTPLTFAVYLSADTTVLTSPGVIMENGLCRSVVTEAASGAYSHTHTLTLNCDVLKFFNRDRHAMINDHDLAGSAAANPAEQAYFIITAWQGFALTTSQTVTFEVLLAYDAWFTEPRKLAAS